MHRDEQLQLSGPFVVFVPFLFSIPLAVWRDYNDPSLHLKLPQRRRLAQPSPAGRGCDGGRGPSQRGPPAESRLRLLTLLLGGHSLVFVQAFIMTPFKQVAATDKTHALAK